MLVNSLVEEPSLGETTSNRSLTTFKAKPWFSIARSCFLTFVASGRRTAEARTWTSSKAFLLSQDQILGTIFEICIQNVHSGVNVGEARDHAGSREPPISVQKSQEEKNSFQLYEILGTVLSEMLAEGLLALRGSEAPV